jgi:hypothetical protein
MVHSPKPVVVTNGNNLNDGEFAQGETIHFGNMEFITDCFGNMSLSPEGNESCIVFIGMVHSRSPSLHSILEESSNEGDTASSRGGRSGFPALEGATW